MFKSVIFDIGGTLVFYHKSLNWTGLYRPALELVADKCNYCLSEEQYKNAEEVLLRYNTRVNPREEEVSSERIFTEILDIWEKPKKDIERAKYNFYSFFSRKCEIYPEVEDTLSRLFQKGIALGTLSDVPYGMDNEFVLKDISEIRKYIAYPFTSNDVGYRKPRADGLKMLAEKTGIPIDQTVFVGDEDKDILCAENAGAYAVLINRERIKKNYGQDMEINSLSELLTLFEK